MAAMMVGQRLAESSMGVVALCESVLSLSRA